MKRKIHPRNAAQSVDLSGESRSADKASPVNRRSFLAGGAASLAAVGMTAGNAAANNADDQAQKVIVPPLSTNEAGEVTPRIFLSCKLGMISNKQGDRSLSLAERLRMAAEAGFDGVDLDQAAGYTPEQARRAVQESGVFVHNAINHAHWSKRLTDPDPKVRAQGRANIEHCIRVSHAAGGSGVLIVVGHGKDGSPEQVADRAREEIKKLLPLSAALGQPILIENVWNNMFYQHDGPADQTADQFVEFVDSFNSPWVGMYYDIGNHWKYGQPGVWIRAFGHRCVKLDVKGFSREKDKFTGITEGDLPWDKVREALADIGFSGWATAEVGGGGVDRLTKVREQMQQALLGA